MDALDYTPCMPRAARIVVPGLPHHITQRGNNRQQVFFTEDDRRVYLALLHKKAEKCGVAVMGYCLMTNHLHLVAVPARKDSLAKAIGAAHLSYVLYLQERHNSLTGHLWQNRFFSCVLDEAACWAALRYVERNPVRAGMVRQARDYPWSSTRAHCGLSAPGIPLDLAAWRAAWSPEEWQAWLGDTAEAPIETEIRANTLSGRPLGSDGFLAMLEQMLGRRLRHLPVGRPRRNRDSYLFRASPEGDPGALQAK